MFIPEGSKILFLDDDKERHQAFAECMDDRFEVTHTWRYFETLKALENTKFHTIFLDHDLGDHIDADIIYGMYSNSPTTGEDVARWIVENPSSHPVECVVHSANPSGARNIESWMERVSKVTVVSFPILLPHLRSFYSVNDIPQKKESMSPKPS